MSGAVPVVAIDGPSGSGKGTVAREVALRLGWHLLDSGAIYRLLALASERLGIATDDEPGLVDTAHGSRMEFRPRPEGDPLVLLDHQDVSGEIRTETCGDRASQVAAYPAVRAALLQRQRDFRQPPGLVADGRDMGTVVFPDAPLKIFLTASVEERARRRYKQLKDQGASVNLTDLSEEIAARDRRDADRPVSPLVPAPDAIRLDTTGVTVDEVVERVLALARERVSG